MKRWPVVLGVVLLCLGLQARAENIRALLIGVSQYQELDGLRYADADVKGFQQVLTEFAGYRNADVTMILNQEATRERIMKEISNVVRASKRERLDHFILMFAGHGMPSRLEAGRVGNAQAMESNIFLAPTDASIMPSAFFSTRSEVRNDTFIDRAWLARQLAEIEAKAVVIILDSCYSGTTEFGELFFENLGYSIRSFDYSGPQRGVKAGVGSTQRNLSINQTSGAGGERRIAYFASSREDQPSAEYDELKHGALSYSIFENIQRARAATYDTESKNITVSDMYSNIAAVFKETKVNGRALGDVHQPLLLPIPNYEGVKEMEFLSVRGIKRKEIPVAVPVPVPAPIPGPVAANPVPVPVPVPAPVRIPDGTLELRTDPPGLQIYVDGTRRPETTPARVELQEGKQFIEIYMPMTGYRHTFTVDMVPGRNLTQTLSMRGNMQVAAYYLVNGQKQAGPQVEVFINGQPFGRSGSRIDNLIAGTHTLEVRFEGVTKQRRVEIRPDSPLLVNYSIIRQQAAAPARPRDNGASRVVF